MGYTHYFELKAELTEDALNDIKAVLKTYNRILRVYREDAGGINLNGIGSDAYETFAVLPHREEFCKTAKKPYDLPVCEILLILKHHYKESFNLDSDGFWVSREQYEKKELDGHWNEALQNVKKRFGYTVLVEGVKEGRYHRFNLV